MCRSLLAVFAFEAIESWKATSKAKLEHAAAALAARKARPGVPRSPGLNNLSSLDRRSFGYQRLFYRTWWTAC